MPYLDLTHAFTPHMPVFPGDPTSEFKPIASLAEQGYCDYQVSTGMHVGTHMDGPAHLLENGRSLALFPIDHFVGRGLLLDGRNGPLDLKLLEGKTLKKGDIVLILTGWSEHWKKENYFFDYPEVGLDLAQALIDAQVKIVGIDTPSPDSKPFEIHKIFLRQEILILENLNNLSLLLEVQDFEVVALPVKFQTDSAPVRVIAKTY